MKTEIKIKDNMIYLQVAKNTTDGNPDMTELNRPAVGADLANHTVKYYRNEKPPYTEIWYKTIDNQVINLLSSLEFGGAKIQSNQYANERGVITFDKNVPYFAKSAFSGKTTLETVTIPATVTGIGSNAFAECERLYEANIPTGVTIIEGWAFNHTRLTEVKLPATLTKIEQYAFASCGSLTAVTFLATTVPTIDPTAFNNCSAQMKIRVPADSLNAYKADPAISRFVFEAM